MQKFTLIVLFVFQLFILNVNSQETEIKTPKIDRLSLGVGFGQEYGGIGGIGANLSVFLSKNFGVFAALGNNSDVSFMGANAGFKIRSVPKNTNQKMFFYISGMFGTNGVISVKNSTSYDRAFFGPSLGLGFDLRPNPSRYKSHWSIGITIPFRTIDYDQYLSKYRGTDGLPFVLAIGYKLGI
ncbi:MAG: hypothetical protein ACOYOT_12900 [Bacteroidales bacterium]